MPNFTLKINTLNENLILNAECIPAHSNTLNYHTCEYNDSDTYAFYFINSEITINKLYLLTDYLTENSADFTIIFE